MTANFGSCSYDPLTLEKTNLGSSGISPNRNPVSWLYIMATVSTPERGSMGEYMGPFRGILGVKTVSTIARTNPI